MVAGVPSRYLRDLEFLFFYFRTSAIPHFLFPHFRIFCFRISAFPPDKNFDSCSPDPAEKISAPVKNPGRNFRTSGSLIRPENRRCLRSVIISAN